MERTKKILTGTVRRSQCVGLAVALLVWLGCAKPPELETAQVEPKDAGPVAIIDRPDPSPSDIQLPQFYGKLPAYSDSVVMHQTYHFDDGRKETNSTTFTTRFARPNKLDLLIASDDNQVSIVCDGNQLTARILDPVTRNFDSQVVVRDAPEILSISAIYKATELIDPIAPGEMLSALLGTPAGLDMTPLGLLVNEGMLVQLVSEATSLPTAAQQVLPGAVERSQYQILEKSVAEGTYRFWIDVPSGVLRKIEFPATTDNLPPGLRRVELIAEVNEVQLTAADNDFHVDTDGQRVSHFVLPPLPPASKLLGERVDRFSLADATGQATTIDNGDSDIVVLTWFHDHPESQLVVGQLELVRSRNEDPRVRFVSVSTDQQVSDQTLKKWGIESTTYFDSMAAGRDVLGVAQAPTTVVLGENNTVHYFEVGANPNIGNDVAVVLERLLAGQNVARETLSIADQADAAYKRQLSLAKSRDGWVEQIEAEIPPPSKPASLVLTDRWKSLGISEPGNMLIVPGRRKQIVVADGWNRLAVLDSQGRLSRHIELELPANDGITLLRAGKGERDRALIAAATRGGRRAYVFDFGGKLLMQYPRIPNEGSLIGDLTVSDMNGDGEAELVVGWQGGVGVQAVSMKGKHLWTNRAASEVVSLTSVLDTSAAKDRRPILVASESGLLYLIDEHGRTLREVSLGPARVHRAVAWPGSARGFGSLVSGVGFPRGPNAGIHCCFSLAAGGNVAVIAADKDWQPIWNYTLPSGVYRHQLDFPQSITLPGIGPIWLLPGADGSLHFVSVDGEFKDAFYVGKHIRGLAGLNIDGKAIVLIATDGEVSALEVAVDSSDAD